MDAGDGEVKDALALVEQGLGLLTGMDPTGLSESAVTGAVRRLGKLGGRLEGVQARFVAAAAAAGVPDKAGAKSTTSWVAQQTGRSGGQAARTGRLADASQTAPELAAAVAAGEVGPDQADTIASGLDRGELDPADLAELLPAARRQDPAMFRREARRLAGERRQDRLRDAELVARDQRSHRQWRTPDGSLRYEGLLPPAEGDTLETALAALHQPDSAEIPHDQRRSHQQRCADAMAALAAAALRAGQAGDTGGVRPHITITVPFHAMAALHDATDAALTATTDLGTVLSMAAYRKLACDATFRRLVIDPDGQPLDIGRATRRWPAAVRAAITAIDGGCRGPGCDLPPHRTILHHVHWWQLGGPTSADNGAMLCDHHHDLIHDHGWTLHLDPATRRCTWTTPTGTTHTTHPRGPAAPHPDPTTEPTTTTTTTTTATAISPTTATSPDRPTGRGDPERPRPPGPEPPPRRRGGRDPVPHDSPADPLQLDL